MQQEPPKNFLRSDVLSRFENCCFVCGMRESRSERLTVHHIVPHCFGGSDDMENLIPLCRLCHREVHKSLEERMHSMLLSHASQDMFRRIIDDVKSPEYCPSYLAEARASHAANAGSHL